MNIHDGKGRINMLNSLWSSGASINKKSFQKDRIWKFYAAYENMMISIQKPNHSITSQSTSQFSLPSSANWGLDSSESSPAFPPPYIPWKQSSSEATIRQCSCHQSTCTSLSRFRRSWSWSPAWVSCRFARKWYSSALPTSNPGIRWYRRERPSLRILNVPR